MTLDAIIIADAGNDTFSGTNPMKLTLDDHVADIQTLINYLDHQGRVVQPIEDAATMNWASAPKLNGIYLQSFLTQNDMKVGLVNNYYDQKETFRELLRQSPRVILISTTFIVDKQTLTKLVADIRSLSDDIPIVAGGPYICFSCNLLERARENNYLPEPNKKGHLFLEMNDEPSIDLYIISPRGEYTVLEVIQRIRNSEPFDTLPNTAVLNENGYFFSQRIDDRQTPIAPINWLEVDSEVFRSGVIPMQASNGCPYNCAFCNFVKDPKLTRIKSIEEIIEEIKQVYQRGARYIWFVDDNFRLGNKDLEDFCRQLIAADVDIHWMTLIRANVIENVDLKLLRKAGCIEVQLGLESGDAEILNNMNKKATPELYQKVLYNTLAAGINCSCYLIFGFPGETEASVQRTIAFMKQFDDIQEGGTITWSFFPFVLAPLSPVYEPEAREKYGLEGHLRNWRHDTMDSDQALKQVRKAFFEIKSSGAIYRTDNLELLRRMPARQVNAFFQTRHSLAKRSAMGVLTKQEILKDFQGLL